MVVIKKKVEGEIVIEGCNGKEAEEVTFVFIKKKKLHFFLNFCNQLHFKQFICFWNICN
jgi:hypothetical protein